ncbi:MAG TPA: biotin/lipoyl-containing protein, partial [Candidatus Binatia bacterium]|nr:biotin/lipoyl-containing protein [Candidatus Binatia bacterium]
RSSTSSLVGIGPAAGGPGAERATARSRPRRPVTSPAVGLFRPTPGFAVGRRVRSGDRIGVVDVLGVPHDVVAPTDGLVTEVVVEAGQPVEYGQELGSIEPLGPEAAGASSPGTATPGTPTPGTSTPGTSTPGTSAPGTSTPGTPTPDTAGGS